MKDSKENELDFLEAAIEFEDIIIRYRLIPKEEVEGLDVMGNYYLFTIQQKHIKKFLNSFCEINGLPEVGDRQNFILKLLVLRLWSSFLHSLVAWEGCFKSIKD